MKKIILFLLIITLNISAEAHKDCCKDSGGFLPIANSMSFSLPGSPPGISFFYFTSNCGCDYGKDQPKFGPAFCNCIEQGPMTALLSSDKVTFGYLYLTVIGVNNLDLNSPVSFQLMSSDGVPLTNCPLFSMILGPRTPTFEQPSFINIPYLIIPSHYTRHHKSRGIPITVQVMGTPLDFTFPASVIVDTTQSGFAFITSNSTNGKCPNTCFESECICDWQ